MLEIEWGGRENFHYEMMNSAIIYYCEILMHNIYHKVIIISYEFKWHFNKSPLSTFSIFYSFYLFVFFPNGYFKINLSTNFIFTSKKHFFFSLNQRVNFSHLKFYKILFKNIEYNRNKYSSVCINLYLINTIYTQI